MKKIIYITLLLLFPTVLSSQITQTWIKDTSYLKIGKTLYGDTIFYFNNIANGQLDVYFDKNFNKKYITVYFKNGQKVGELTKFCIDGKINSKTFFDINSNDSIYMEWYSNEVIKKKVFYDKTDIWKSQKYLEIEYYKNSNVKKITIYQDNNGYYCISKIIEYEHAGMKSTEQSFKLIQEEEENGNLIDILVPQPIQYFINGREIEKEIFEKL